VIYKKDISGSSPKDGCLWTLWTSLDIPAAKTVTCRFTLGTILVMRGSASGFSRELYFKGKKD